MKIQQLSKITECSPFRNGIRVFNTTPKRNVIPLGQKINYNTSKLLLNKRFEPVGRREQFKKKVSIVPCFSPAEEAEYHENFLSPVESTTFLKRKQNFCNCN